MHYADLIKSTQGIVTNIDLDGFLSYAIIKKTLGCPLLGFANSRDHIYIKNSEPRVEFKDCFFLDFYINSLDVKSHEQHIIAYNTNHSKLIANSGNKINPNLDRDRTWIDTYKIKFPLSTCFDVIFRFETEGVKVDIDLDKIVFDDVTLKDFIFYTDSTWENATKYRDNMLEWFNYELDSTDYGKLTSELYDYCYTTLVYDASKMEKIKTFLAETFVTCGKTCDGWKTKNEWNQEMFNMLEFCCQLCGCSSDVSIDDFHLYSNYDYDFKSIGAYTNVNDVFDLLDKSLSYSFVYGPNSKYKNLSFTYLGK